MKRSITRQLAICLLTFVGTLQTMADLTFTQAAGGFPIVGSEGNAVFVVSENDAEVVTTAARCVIQDIKAVTGKQLALTSAQSLPRSLQRGGEPTYNVPVSLGEMIKQFQRFLMKQKIIFLLAKMK